MKPNRPLLFLVSILVIVLLFPALVLSQNGEITYFDYKIIQNINLTNNVSDIKTINMFWIDENRLLFQADRQVSLIINPTKPDETVSKGLTNYLWVLGENRFSHFTYIKESDVIMLVEETPPKLLIFDGKGDNYKVIDELSGEDYKAEFIKSNKKILIFANKEIAFYDYASGKYEIPIKNVGRYTYHPETNELLVFYNTGKEIEKRKRYDIAIIDITSLQEKIKITDVTDAIYYSKSGRLFYSKPETFHNTSLIEILYPSRPNDKLSFANKIGYKDFFNAERFTLSGEIQNKMSLTYSKDNSVYIWTEPHEIPTDTKTIAEKRLIFTADPYDKDKVKHSIDNIIDYMYNSVKNDILIFRRAGNNIEIEKRNVASPDDKVKITDSAIKVDKFFHWFKEKNIIVYIEQDNIIRCYDLENNKELFKVAYVNVESKINVNIVDDELIALSYINNKGKGVGDLYHIKHNILTEFKEEIYFIIPSKTYGAVAALRKADNSGTATISFYQCEAHTEEPPTKETIIGPFGIGFKIGGVVTSMLVVGNVLDFGFEFTIFANMTIAEKWMIELGVGIGSRFFSFDDDINPGLSNDSKVNTVLLSVNLLARYMFPQFYIPFGIRANFLLYTDIAITLPNGSVGIFAFNENVNVFSLDIVAGCGAKFPVTKQMDLFIELLVMFNVAPALFKPNFTTDPATPPTIEGRDLVFQVNIGLNLFKFGKIEDNEIDVLKNRFQIGAKIGTNLNTMFVYAAEVALGYELSVFGGIKVADNWLLGLDILFGGRNESFNQERGNLPSESTIVNTTLFGLQASARCTFDFSGKGLENQGANGLFIPFGLRANFNFYNTITVQSGTFDFTNYVNPVSMDVFAGVGYIFYITDKMDIFGELLFVFNVAPAFYKANFTTVTSDSSSQIDGRYFGIQLNIGFTFLKF